MRRTVTPRINDAASKKFFHSHGKKSIFLARFMGPMSWITPFIAGTLHVKYKDFIKYNAPGVILGIGTFLVIGYFFGFSYNLVLHKILKDILYLVLILFAIFIYFIMVRLGIIDRINKKLRSLFAKSNP